MHETASPCRTVLVLPLIANGTVSADADDDDKSHEYCSDNSCRHANDDALVNAVAAYRQVAILTAASGCPRFNGGVDELTELVLIRQTARVAGSVCDVVFACVARIADVGWR